MTSPLRVVTLALLLTLTACNDAPPHEPASDTAGARPDLLLVVVDTLRADHLSTYGYPRPTSPHIDALAERGVLFTDVTAQSSWTQPSMASMLSGRQLYVNAHRLPERVESLAERLSAAGYETAAFVANPNLSGEGGYDRGFDHFIGRDDTGGTTWNAPDLEGAVKAWLELNPPGEAPRFLYLHYLDPHWPYAPVEDTPLAGAPHVRADTEAAWTADRNTPEVEASFDTARQSMIADIDAYDREIAVTDRSLARLLDATARDRERLVVLASDHGEGLWDHHEHARNVKPPGDLRERFFRDHSYHMWQELIFTPLIVQGVGFEAGLRLDTPVQNVDIMPTLLRAAGLPLDAEGDGVALQDVVAQQALPEERLLVSHSNEGTMLRRPGDALKFVFPTATGFAFGMPIQAYALDVDPGERHNLHDAITQDRQHSLRDDLQWLYRAREQRSKAFALYPDGSHSATDDQQRVLEELGYAGGDSPAPPDSDSDG
ncbi:MAG: hypothetical protein DHS20C15_00080 [Planctomycetota bacterium]|nr:MAG: hypothetical protein DHS20C15_00080 [Planctomycetota bacterium]